jgi:DNA-binding NarL/FixJ family response regulator
MIRVVVFEDNTDFADGLKEILSASSDMSLLAVFNNARDAARKALPLQPDVILMDIDMPQANGLEGLRTIRSVNEDVSVLMLTVFDDNENVFQAICDGATGYVLKKTDPEQLLRFIREAHNGGAPMTPKIARQVLQLFSQPFKNKKDLEQLTAREHDVLTLLVRGFSYKMAASELGLSIDTISTHVKKIYTKLHVNSKSEAVAKALQNRIV